MIYIFTNVNLFIHSLPALAADMYDSMSHPIGRTVLISTLISTLWQILISAFLVIQSFFLLPKTSLFVGNVGHLPKTNIVRAAR